MKLEEQVSNFQLSKKLYELGFKAKNTIFESSNFFWHNSNELYFMIHPRKFFCVSHHKDDFKEILHCMYPAYSVSELGKLLPKVIPHNLNNWSGGYYIIFAYSNQDELGESNPCVWYEDNDLSDEDSRLNGTEAKTEADARAQMLIWLIENGKIVIDDKK